MRWLLGLLVCLPLAMQAQKVIDVDQNERVDQSMFYVVNGEAFVNTKFVRLTSGTPYFKDEWLAGNIVTTENKVLINVKLKLDLVDHKVHYLTNDGEKIATTPLKKITLTDSARGEEFRFVNTDYLTGFSLKEKWIQNLVQGKTELYRYFDKQLKENRPYGSATVEQSIHTIDRYYLFIENAFVEIKKPKDPVSYFPDHQMELQAFWKESRGSQEEKLKSLIEFYNNL